MYAAHGWSGFNFETVSKAASAGRPALYRRWPDRDALLADALLSRSPEVTDVDLGSLAAELSRLINDYLKGMQGGRGRVGLRLYLEAERAGEEVAAVQRRLMERRHEVVAAALRRAEARAGRPSQATDQLVFALLFGGALLWDAHRQVLAPDTEAIIASLIRLTGLS